MKNFFNAVLWVVMQAGAFALVWYGVHGHAITWNIYRAMAWFTTMSFFVLALGLNVRKSATPEEIAKWPKLISKLPVPRKVSTYSDFAIALLLAAFGHFGYATLKVIEQFLEIYVLEVREECATREAKFKTEAPAHA